MRTEWAIDLRDHYVARGMAPPGWIRLGLILIMGVATVLMGGGGRLGR